MNPPTGRNDARDRKSANGNESHANGNGRANDRCDGDQRGGSNFRIPSENEFPESLRDAAKDLSSRRELGNREATRYEAALAALGRSFS